MVKLPELYPWQQSDWAQIAGSLHRLPHAILITGTEGIGKFRFATRLAISLLCESTEYPPCGECRNCRLFSAATHPDLHVFTSEAKLTEIDELMVNYAERYLEDKSVQAKRKNPRETIVVDQIRSLIECASIKPHLADNKVFLIDPVDKMTNSGANSLLKVLEEPPSNTFLILIAESTQKLLPTITSRCQKLTVSAPSREMTERWLGEQKISSEQIKVILDSRKGPLVGLQRNTEDELFYSQNFVKKVLHHLQQEQKGDISELVEFGTQMGESECLSELQLLVSDLISQNISNLNQPTLNIESKPKLADQIDVRELFAVYDHIGNLREQLRVGGMDKTLAVEDALLAFENGRY